ncbi:MAG TPA: SH3 domain-containing protein [Caldilineaceae bacterium]|nr:SH3 domain-containing protein [Caldilineaceae bacterium]
MGGIVSFGPEPTAVPTPDEARAIVPTFTPTPELPPATATSLPPVVVANDESSGANSADVAPTAAPVEEVPTDAPTEAPTATLESGSTFTVSEPVVNVRLGPGTNYGIAGSVEAGQSFDIEGKTSAGDWLQVCCVNGQTVWIFAQLGAAQNVEAVAVAQDIPALPTATPTPVPQPTDTPAPAAPPPAADPCAGIGGDGCKFKVREGPQFAPNGGNELKLQLYFIHSGVDGGQPQGSYFVVLMKDGQNLGVSDTVRSIANDASDGALGRYNYEYKIGLDKLPGNTVAGNYTMFVLDGNGERDSQDLNFSVPEGQGEVRVVWDQG